MSKLFIFTLNWNGSDKLTALYPTLINNLSNIENYEWWIKDNGSSDNSLNIIRSFNNDKVQILESGHNRDSFALGMNKLFQAANPDDDDIILLLNNDIVFNDKTSIINMMRLINRDEVGAVGARLLYPNSDILQHAGVVFNVKHKLPVHWKAKQKSDKYDKLNREFQAVTGAVLMTKAIYYKQICTTNKSKIHGLNESYVWMYEDIDACLAIKYRLNKKIIFCGQTSISHEESASLKKNPINKPFIMQNVNFLIKYWGSFSKIDEPYYERNNNYMLYI